MHNVKQKFNSNSDQRVLYECNLFFFSSAPFFLLMSLVS